MKTKINMHERIAVRAYYAWLAGSTAGAATDWHGAEAIETALAERRAAAATKAAATRRTRTKTPAEMLVASKGTLSVGTLRPTAH